MLSLPWQGVQNGEKKDQLYCKSNTWIEDNLDKTGTNTADWFFWNPKELLINTASIPERKLTCSWVLWGPLASPKSGSSLGGPCHCTPSPSVGGQVSSTFLLSWHLCYLCWHCPLAPSGPLCPCNFRCLLPGMLGIRTQMPPAGKHHVEH